MSQINLKVYAEVYIFLNKLGIEFINRLPKSLYKFICDKSSLYCGEPITVLSPKAVSFIAMLHYNYWIDNEKEKDELFEILKANEKIRREKYNVNNVLKKEDKEEFKNKSQNLNVQNQIVSENVYIAQIPEEKWYMKVFNFIKKILKKGCKK